MPEVALREAGDATVTADPSTADMLRSVIQQHENNQEQQKELLLQGFANLTEISQEIKTHTVTLTQSLIAIHESIKQSLNVISEARMQNVSPNIESNTQSNASTSSTVTQAPLVSRIVLTQPETPPSFGGLRSNPIRFLQELETYFKKVNLQEIQQLEVAMDCLTGSARNWATIYRRVWRTFEHFRSDFVRTYWSEQEQQKLRHRIFTETWTNDKYTMMDHFAYFVNMAEQLTNPFPETELVSHLIRHYPVHIQSLWLLSRKTTLAGVAEFLRQQENIVTFQHNNLAAPKRTKTISAMRIGSRYQPYSIDRRTSSFRAPARPENTINFVPATDQQGKPGNEQRSSQ